MFNQTITDNIEQELNLPKWFEKGGPGSGHWRHAGRPGKRGGSAPSKVGKKLSAPTGDIGKYEAVGVADWLNQSAYGKSFADTGAWANAIPDQRAELKAKVARDLSDATGEAVTEQEAADFVSQWAHSSNDDDMRSLAIQQDAAKEFGVELSEFTQSKIDKVQSERKKFIQRQRDRYYKNLTDEEIAKIPGVQSAMGKLEPLMESDKQRALLRSMYNETQAELKARGITEVRLYRGIKVEGETYTDLKRAFLSDNPIEASTNSVESWSIGYEAAKSFADFGESAVGQYGVPISKYGVVLEAVIPTSRILSTPATGFGCLTEGEVVVLGGVTGDIVSINDLEIY